MDRLLQIERCQFFFSSSFMVQVARSQTDWSNEHSPARSARFPKSGRYWQHKNQHCQCIVHMNKKQTIQNCKDIKLSSKMLQKSFQRCRKESGQMRTGGVRKLKIMRIIISISILFCNIPEPCGRATYQYCRKGEFCNIDKIGTSSLFNLNWVVWLLTDSVCSVAYLNFEAVLSIIPLHLLHLKAMDCCPPSPPDWTLPGSLVSRHHCTFDIAYVLQLTPLQKVELWK